MKTLLFYCQHTLGIDHLMGSMAIAHGLMQDFQVYFVNGGEVIHEFPISQGIKVINLPVVRSGVGISALQGIAPTSDVNSTLKRRRDLLLELCDRIHPDAVMLEQFPFGHHQFFTELIPLLKWAKEHSVKTICSVRDIVVARQDQASYETKVCQLINRYFDQLLIHGDPSFIALDKSFSRVGDLTCEIYYTGYVVPNIDREFTPRTNADPPMILVSTGGGRFGYELLDCIAEAAQYLEDKIPHDIRVFTGPFAPIEIFSRLQKVAARCSNLSVERYTPDLLGHMAKADLFISMASYTATLNMLQIGVRSIQLPCTDNYDQDQRLRSQRLEDLDLVKVIETADLDPVLFSFEIIEILNRQPSHIYFCLRGVQITAARVGALVTGEDKFAPLTRVLRFYS
ncbi:MAG: glycosyltransferase [Cyanobacteria bacterium P01_H01_bin.21]